MIEELRQGSLDSWCPHGPVKSLYAHGVDWVNFRFIFCSDKIEMYSNDFDYAVFFIANYVTDNYDNHDIEYMSTHMTLSQHDLMS